MPAVKAQSLVPGLIVRDDERAADAGALDRLALWALQRNVERRIRRACLPQTKSFDSFDFLSLQARVTRRRARADGGSHGTTLIPEMYIRGGGSRDRFRLAV
jgi:hypothetical protein